MKKQKIFISTSTFGEYDRRPLERLEECGFEYALNPYRRKLTSEECLKLLGDSVGLIAGVECLDDVFLNQAKHLKVISRCGVGLDNVGLEKAGEMGIEVFNTPDTVTAPVAELTVGLLLALLRRIPSMDKAVKEGVWQKQMGSLLSGKCVGIIGFGRIGQSVARLLLPFGVTLNYADITSKDVDLFIEQRSIDDLLSWADVVLLHCSVPKEDGGVIIGKNQIKLMKEGAWLINVSRGEVLDEQALYVALKDNYLSGAALDVFINEPYRGPLCGLDNVILTPHIGSYAREARIQMEKESVENLLRGLQIALRGREVVR